MLKGYSNKKASRKSNRLLEVQQFKWGCEQQAAFELLKKKISEDVVLAYPDFKKPFRLCCDASRNGLGASFEQEQDDGHFRPVAFASRRTSDAEKHYPIHKLEFLNLKWSITEKFRDYLRSSSFVVYTDNNPLVYVFKNAKLDATSQRWLASLEPYDFVVKYKSGINNVVADALSRKYDTDVEETNTKMHDWAKERCKDFDKPDDSNNLLATITLPDTISQNITVSYDWHILQATDSTISTVKTIINDNSSDNSDQPQHVKSLLKERSNLLIHNGLLYHREKETTDVPYSETDMRLVVPANQQRDLVKLYHGFGHFGITRVYKLMKQRFYWPNMRQEMVQACSTCERCQRAKTPKDKNKGPLTHLITPSRPMHQLSIDLLSIDTKAQTKCKILTCVDEFTKFAFGILVKSENAEHTAEQLYKQVYTKFGIPDVIHSDRGATFLSKVLKELNNLLGIRHTTTTAYRPQSNGSCEILNATLIERIRTLQPREKRRWHLHIDSLVLAYNTTVHESIEMSPFFTMYGRRPKIPIDLMVRLPDTQSAKTVSTKKFVEEREKELKHSFELCAKNIKKRQNRSKRNFDNKLKHPTLYTFRMVIKFWCESLLPETRLMTDIRLKSTKF